MEARLHLALLYGLRQGEALGLKWSDIDLESRTLKVDLQVRRVAGELRFIELKTAASRRVIHLAAQTVQVLKSHKDLLRLSQIQMSDRWEESGLVFPNKNGKVQQSKWDYELWKKALQKVGLEHRSLHHARHTAGTLMYANGVGIETIRRILGHASVTTTSSTYVHTAEEPLRKAALAMDDLFSSNCSN
jgi:integrase